MSWQLVSVVVLLFTLRAGMLWYERSRPPSQIVALVAVLAALAVAGRICACADPERGRDHRHRDHRRFRAQAGPRVRGRCPGRAGLKLLAPARSLDALADGCLGHAVGWRCPFHLARGRGQSLDPGRLLRAGRGRFRRLDES